MPTVSKRNDDIPGGSNNSPANTPETQRPSANDAALNSDQQASTSSEASVDEGDPKKKKEEAARNGLSHFISTFNSNIYELCDLSPNATEATIKKQKQAYFGKFKDIPPDEVIPPEILSSIFQNHWYPFMGAAYQDLILTDGGLLKIQSDDSVSARRVDLAVKEYFESKSTRSDAQNREDEAKRIRYDHNREEEAERIRQQLLNRFTHELAFRILLDAEARTYLDTIRKKGLFEPEFTISKKNKLNKFLTCIFTVNAFIFALGNAIPLLIFVLFIIAGVASPAPIAVILAFCAAAIAAALAYSTFKINYKIGRAIIPAILRNKNIFKGWIEYTPEEQALYRERYKCDPPPMSAAKKALIVSSALASGILLGAIFGVACYTGTILLATILTSLGVSMPHVAVLAISIVAIIWGISVAFTMGKAIADQIAEYIRTDAIKQAIQWFKDATHAERLLACLGLIAVISGIIGTFLLGRSTLKDVLTPVLGLHGAEIGSSLILGVAAPIDTIFYIPGLAQMITTKFFTPTYRQMYEETKAFLSSPAAKNAFMNGAAAAIGMFLFLSSFAVPISWPAMIAICSFIFLCAFINSAAAAAQGEKKAKPTLSVMPDLLKPFNFSIKYFTSESKDSTHKETNDSRKSSGSSDEGYDGSGNHDKQQEGDGQPSKFFSTSTSSPSAANDSSNRIKTNFTIG